MSAEARHPTLLQGRTSSYWGSGYRVRSLCTVIQLIRWVFFSGIQFWKKYRPLYLKYLSFKQLFPGEDASFMSRNTAVHEDEMRSVLFVQGSMTGFLIHCSSNTSDSSGDDSGWCTELSMMSPASSLLSVSGLLSEKVHWWLTGPEQMLPCPWRKGELCLVVLRLFQSLCLKPSMSRHFYSRGENENSTRRTNTRSNHNIYTSVHGSNNLFFLLSSLWQNSKLCKKYWNIKQLDTNIWR